MSSYSNKFLKLAGFVLVHLPYCRNLSEYSAYAMIIRHHHASQQHQLALSALSSLDSHCPCYLKCNNLSYSTV